MILIPKPTYLIQPFWTKRARPAATLNSAEIETVLAHYNLGNWQIARILSGGNSENVLLQTGRGQKVLKRYRWSLASTQYEHSILGYLANTDFPTPRLEVNQSGLTCTDLGQHHYAIYEFVPGYCYTNYLFLGKTRRRLVSQAGETLARLHQLTVNFVPAGRKLNGFMPGGEGLWRDVAWHLETLEQYFESVAAKKPSDDLKAFLLKIAAELKHDLIEIERYYQPADLALPRAIIHGDYSPKNILFRGQTIAAVLDFGDACVNLRTLDVARGVTAFGRAGRYGVDRGLAQSFLRAYQTHQPLLAQEVEAIPDLIRWRYLQNMIWLLQAGRLKSNSLALIRDKWAAAQWIKTHAAGLRAMLLAAPEGKEK